MRRNVLHKPVISSAQDVDSFAETETVILRTAPGTEEIRPVVLLIGPERLWSSRLASVTP